MLSHDCMRNVSAFCGSCQLFALFRRMLVGVHMPRPNKLLTDKQYGFHSSSSILISHRINENLDGKYVTKAISLYISSTFDKMRHRELLHEFLLLWHPRQILSDYQVLSPKKVYEGHCECPSPETNKINTDILFKFLSSVLPFVCFLLTICVGIFLDH